MLTGAKVRLPPAVGHVPGDDQQLQERAAVIEHRGDRDLPPPWSASGCPAEAFERGGFAVPGERDCRLRGDTMLAFPEIDPRAVDQILRAQAEQSGSRRVQIDNAPLEIEDLHAIGAAVNEVAAQRLELRASQSVH